MSVLSKLKSRRKNLDELAKKMKEDATGKASFQKDDRFYYPQLDENGSGYAVIRFIPPQWEEEPNYVRMYKHEFKGVGGWIIENCPTSLGRGSSCPICEANAEAWTSGDKETASRRKRKMYFITNIVVVKDPANPENEGKVFLFRFGKKIMDKLVLALEPEFPDDPIFDPYDLWEGANFKLKIRKVEGQTNYDLSGFDEVSQLAPDEKLEEIVSQTYKLSDFITPSEFKSYDELKERFEIVEGLRKAGGSTAAKPAETDVDDTPKPSKSLPEEDAFPLEEDEPPFSLDDDDEDLFS